MNTNYYIYQNRYVGAIEVSKEEYESAMNRCKMENLEHTQDKDESKCISAIHDHFAQNGKYIVCFSKITSKGK